ncbi:DNA repair protein [Vibrio ponticus]|uniref:DNA repair protein n=1 Tax=Vibrio ponticus TaxID=265668 RepID=A0ABX3FIH2_9VIBR|nr:alpha-ketoglutarate-dependent dioxygenase AlkB [Vibrio ponticus]OLQ91610.1 DNA repair protein [Vibrio ponticus]
MSNSPNWLQVDKGNLLHVEQFLTQNQADQLFQNLMKEITWKQESTSMFGRSVLQPRLQAWFGDRAYQYSGLRLEPNPMPPAIAQLKHQCEQICQQPFNTVLLNLYRDGQDYMGWHQDNEKELGLNPTIASVSLGAERKFSLKQKRGDEKIDFQLSHGSLLVMAGETQNHWRHALPKSRKVSQPRINLTFRNIL